MEKENLEKNNNISLTAYDITKNIINNIDSLDINNEKTEEDLFKKLYRVIIQANDSNYFVQVEGMSYTVAKDSIISPKYFKKFAPYFTFYV